MMEKSGIVHAFKEFSVQRESVVKQVTSKVVRIMWNSGYPWGT